MMEEDVRGRTFRNIPGTCAALSKYRQRQALCDDLVKRSNIRPETKWVQKDIPYYSASPDRQEYLHFPDLEQSSPEHWCPERSRKRHARSYPVGKECKIRSIQVHGEDKKECYAGQRVAINLQM